MVVTRPAPDHHALTQALDGRGLRWIHAPAFELREYPDIGQRVRVLSPGDWVLVTSPATARILIDHVPADLRSRLRWFAPGAATAKVLAENGCEVRTPNSGGTSEEVLALPEFAAAKGKRIAIVGAPGGRQTIGREMESRGARVERLYLYERRPLPASQQLIELLTRRAPAAVLVSSVLVIEHLFATLPESLRQALRDCAFVVSSPRTEDACKRHGAGSIVRARGAGVNELVEALATLP